MLDGAPALTYRFTDRKRLSVSEGDGAAVQAGYGALTLDGLVLFSHLVPRTQRGYTVVVDRDTSLATVFETWFSGYEDNREVQRQVSYGYVEQRGRRGASRAARHHQPHRGQGLLLEAGHRRRNAGVLPDGAVSPTSSSCTRFGGELSFCAPSDYIKINDDKYLYSRVEAEFSGTMTTYLLDPNRVEQIGVRLGFDQTDTLEYLPVPRARRVGGPDRAVRAVRRRRDEDRARQPQPASPPRAHAPSTGR